MIKKLLSFVEEEGIGRRVKRRRVEGKVPPSGSDGFSKGVSEDGIGARVAKRRRVDVNGSNGSCFKSALVDASKNVDQQGLEQDWYEFDISISRAIRAKGAFFGTLCSSKTDLHIK